MLPIHPPSTRLAPAPRVTSLSPILYEKVIASSAIEQASAPGSSNVRSRPSTDAVAWPGAGGSITAPLDPAPLDSSPPSSVAVPVSPSDMTSGGLDAPPSSSLPHAPRIATITTITTSTFFNDLYLPIWTATKDLVERRRQGSGEVSPIPADRSLATL